MKISTLSLFILLEVLLALCIGITAYQLGKSLTGVGLWPPSTVAQIMLGLFAIFIPLTWKIMRMTSCAKDTNERHAEKEAKKTPGFLMRLGIGSLYITIGLGFGLFFGFLVLTAVGSF